MSQKHTYAEIAASWALWNEYVNTDATMTREEFDALNVAQKVALQVEAFGPGTASQPFATTYRAAYINRGAGTVLTTPEQSGLADAELRAAAHAEAMRAGLIGADAEANQLSEDEFAAALVVGEWTE